VEKEMPAMTLNPVSLDEDFIFHVSVEATLVVAWLPKPERSRVKTFLHPDSIDFHSWSS